MYQHLLLPIDGSPLSDLASRHGLQLAGVLGAKATFLHVIPVFRDGATGHGVPSEDLAATYEQAAREETALLLAEAAKRAFSASRRGRTISIKPLSTPRWPRAAI